MTPTNLARLAAWAKITPETQPWLYRTVCGRCGEATMQWHRDAPSNLVCESCGTDYPAKLHAPDPTDPGADPREVDRVWLADVVWTLREEGHGPLVDVLGAESPWVATINTAAREKEAHATSATLALLRAARAAGVPEVVEIMGEEA